MPATLLLLGASTHQLEAIAAARRLGVRVVTLDYTPGNPGHDLADAHHLVSTTDRAAVTAVARRERADGILAFATDVALPVAADVATALGLVAPSAAATFVLCHKTRFREFQREHGFALPAFASWDGSGSPPAWTQPGRCIVKPACASGSKGCRIVGPDDDLAATLAAASGAGLTREVAIEEVIEGHQGTCEGWFDGETITFHLLLDRQTVAPPFVATSGHRVPSILPAATARRLLAELERLFRLLGVERSIFDCDFIARPACGADGGADGGAEVFLLEATLRVGGNSIVRLVRHATGVDLAELAVRVALGEIPTVPAPASVRPTAIVLFGSDRAGRLVYDTAAAARLRAQPWVAALELDCALGDPVIAFTSGRAVVGRALIDATDRAALDQRAQSLERDLALTAETSE